jgi:RNase H-fold protein (predicted Holliday junction resolvase)
MLIRRRIGTGEKANMPNNPDKTSEVTGYVPKELKKEFKITCADEERSMSDVLTEIIGDWVKEKKEKKKKDK